MCTQLVNNWHSRWLEPEQGETGKKGVHGTSPLLQAINYAPLLEIVGRHLKLYAITNRKTNKSLPHFPT